MVLATEWENDADPVPFVSNRVKKHGELSFDDAHTCEIR